MTYHFVDMDQYPRRAHFAHFLTQPNPHLGVTVEVDVTELVSLCRARDWSFYLAMIHLTALAANAVPELRQRIRAGAIVEYDRCDTSHIELLEDGTYCYCTLCHDPSQSLEAYMAEAEARRAKARSGGSIVEDEGVEGLFFLTSLPWLHYTQLTQPTAGAEDSNPRISWGRYEADAHGRLMLPLTLLCHHSLVDGLQLARFYDEVQKRLSGLHM